MSALKIYSPREAEDPDLCLIWKRKDGGSEMWGVIGRPADTVAQALWTLMRYGRKVGDFRLLVYRKLWGAEDFMRRNIGPYEIKTLKDWLFDDGFNEFVFFPDGFKEPWPSDEAADEFAALVAAWFRKWLPRCYTPSWDDPPLGEVDLSGIKMEEWRSEDED